MKKFYFPFFAAALLCAAATLCGAAIDNPSSSQPAVINSTPKGPLKVGVVNFRNCVEQSKMGQQEDANLEALRKQIESLLSEKEKTLNDMEEKLNDPDYVDSISPEAERELKRKYRTLSQEAAMQQNQYSQTLHQANVKVIQKLMDFVTKHAAVVAKNENFDILLTEESSFYYSPALDVSSKVIVLMDDAFERENQAQKTPELTPVPKPAAPSASAATAPKAAPNASPSIPASAPMNR